LSELPEPTRGSAATGAIGPVTRPCADRPVIGSGVTGVMLWAEMTRAGREELVTAGILILSGDGQRSEVLWLDDLAARIIGVSPQEARGADIRALDPSLGATAWEERFRAAASEPIVYRTWFRRDTARPRSYEVRLEQPPVPADAVGASEGTGSAWRVAFVLDRHGSVELEEAFEASRRRWELISSAARDGLWSWDLARDEVAFSPRWCALIGLPEIPVRAPSEAWFRRVHPNDVDGLRAAINEHLEGLTPVLLHEHRMEHDNGTWRWCIVRAVADFDIDGTARLLAGSTSDVTHRKNAEERLRYEAFHDSLTGLANRAWLIHQLHEALESSRTGVPFAVLLLGLDGFKLVNDSFGPSIGDMLLRSVATRLLRNVRAGDTVARLAGDEFLVILDQVADLTEAEAVVERIQRDLSRAFDLRGYSVFTSASLGMVIHISTYIEPEELLRDANIALVRAKSLGRGKRKLFDASMRHETVRRLMLETDLRRALERSELSLYYQPIVSLADGGLLGFEALARWNHAKHGAISPAEFIPLAEESGLILNIGRWALLAACEEAVTWQELSPGARPWVAVNVSGRQLVQPGFPDEVRDVLRLTGLEPARLHLEITESVLMENAEYAREILMALRGLGVGLSIDDFGTGYSSLAALRRFPIQTLKVDRAFLAKDSNQNESWAIVEAIASLARVLGKKVVVEGVEDAEDARRLHQLGCQAAQGFLFARPAPYEQLNTIMSGPGLAALAQHVPASRP
jgi:diguanylate cyclase (GGDEF)-like protein/PAS domain S-box-containing protein